MILFLFQTEFERKQIERYKLQNDFKINNLFSTILRFLARYSSYHLHKNNAKLFFVFRFYKKG